VDFSQIVVDAWHVRDNKELLRELRSLGAVRRFRGAGSHS
jgi:hypothetical protein